jgi:hypothetical protein
MSSHELTAHALQRAIHQAGNQPVTHRRPFPNVSKARQSGAVPTPSAKLIRAMRRALIGEATLGARDTPGPRSTIIQTAGNRMELMPFAQIATRIGGAITVMAALAGVRLPALTLR